MVLTYLRVTVLPMIVARAHVELLVLVLVSFIRLLEEEKRVNEESNRKARVCTKCEVKTKKKRREHEDSEK